MSAEIGPGGSQRDRTRVKCYRCYDSKKWYSIHGPDRIVTWHDCAACQPELR